MDEHEIEFLKKQCSDLSKEITQIRALLKKEECQLQLRKALDSIIEFKSDTKTFFTSETNWKWDNESKPKDYRDKLDAIFQNVQRISKSPLPAVREMFLQKEFEFISFSTRYVWIDPITKKHINVHICCFYKLNKDGGEIASWNKDKDDPRMITSILATTSCRGVKTKALQFDILSINTWEKLLKLHPIVIPGCILLINSFIKK